MTKKIERHLPEKAPKKTGRSGIGPVPEPDVPTSEEVAEFLDGAASTREKRQEKAKKGKKPEIVRDPQRGKTERLPGMQDPEIEELEDAAREYANIRDDRVLLLGKEVELKEELLGMMKKHGKTVYIHDGVEIKLVHEKESVKVKVVKED